MQEEFNDKNHPEKRRVYETRGVHDEQKKMSVMIPVPVGLKSQYQREDFFFTRSADVGKSPTGQTRSDIEAFSSILARDKFRKLYENDKKHEY